MFKLFSRRYAPQAFVILLTLSIGHTAFAEPEPTIHIVDVKARPTAPGAETGAVYLVLMNHGAVDDSLTGMSTPAAETAELHRTVDSGGMSKMDAVPDLTVKSNDGVTFAPGGLHIMLMGLKQQLKPGDSFPLTLNFAKAGAVTVTVAVQPIKIKPKATPDMPGMKM
jgi:copper(I)-binding protein